MKPIHWLAVIPFIGMLVGPAVHNEVDPFILGMPFPSAGSRSGSC